MKNNRRGKGILALMLCIVLAFSGSVSALAEEITTEPVVLEEQEEADAADLVEEEETDDVSAEPTPTEEAEVPETEEVSTEELVTEEPAAEEIVTEEAETVLPEVIEEPVQEEVQENLTAVYEDDKLTVTAAGAVPEDTQFCISSIEKVEINDSMNEEEKAEAEEMNDKYDLTVETLNKKSSEETEYEIKGFQAYDICFVDGEGNEVEPEAAVQLSIDYKEAQIPEELKDETTGAITTKVLHFAEDEEGKITVEEVTEAEFTLAEDRIYETEITGVTFETDSFSTFVLVWTEQEEALQETTEDSEAGTIYFTTEEEEIVEVPDEATPQAYVLLNEEPEETPEGETPEGEVPEEEQPADIQIKTVVMDNEEVVISSDDTFTYLVTVETLPYEGAYYLVDSQTGEYYYLDENDELQKSEEAVVYGQTTSEGMIEGVKLNQNIILKDIDSEVKFKVEAENIPAKYESDPEVTYGTETRDVTVTYQIATQYVWEVFNRSNTGSGLMIGGSEFLLEPAEEGCDTYYGKSDSETGLITWYSDGAMTKAVACKDMAAGKYYLTQTKVGTGYMINTEIWTVVIGENEVPAFYEGKLEDEIITEEMPSLNEQAATSEPFEDEDGVRYVKLSFYYENGIDYALPNAGGNGIFGYTIFGMLLMMAGVLILYHDRFRRVC